MKKYLFTIVPFVISLICFISYHSIGSTITSDGVVSEPFFLIPIGWLFAFIGILSAIIYFIKKAIKPKNL